MSKPGYASHRFRVGRDKRVSHAADLAANLDDALRECGTICLYVLASGKRIVYVGSSKNIGKTLKTGHNRDYPYKWLEAHRGQRLHGHFFAFDLTFPGYEPRVVREAIEGEVVFEIRRLTGRWPSSQIEIHFQEALRQLSPARQAVAFVMQTLQDAGCLR